MKTKGIFAMLLSFMMISFNVLPSLATSLDEEAPAFDIQIMESYEEKEAEDEEEKIEEKIDEIEDEVEEVEEEETEPFSAVPLTQTSPHFTASIADKGSGYGLYGRLSDVPDHVVSAVLLYALDGENYQTSEDFYDWDFSVAKEEQAFMTEQDEPLKSYIAGTITRFYIKMELTGEDGQTYFTEPAVFDRSEVVLLPEDTPVSIRYAANMRSAGRPPNYGKYQITVAEGTTWEQTRAYLPQSIPMEVQIFLFGNEAPPLMGTIEAFIEWRLPNGIADREITDSAVLSFAPNQIVHTALGYFQLNGVPEFDTAYAQNKLHFIPNVVPSGATPTGVLSENYNRFLKCNVLEMAFDLKPTGATAIRVYSFVEGDDSWNEIVHIPLLESVNGQPKFASTDYVTVLREDQGVYQAWRNKELECFWIGIKIEGGVYDKKSMVLAWPEEYERPPNAPDVGGSGGNENNAGGGGGGLLGGGGNSNNSGQRPNLPPEYPETTNPQAPDELQPPSTIEKPPSENILAIGMSKGVNDAPQEPSTPQAPKEVPTIQQPSTTEKPPPEYIPAIGMSKGVNDDTQVLATPQGPKERPTQINEPKKHVEPHRRTENANNANNALPSPIVATVALIVAGSGISAYAGVTVTGKATAGKILSVLRRLFL